MDCSEIDGDICLGELPPILFCAPQTARWNGRDVAALHPSNTFLGGSFTIPDLSSQKADTAAFNQRVLIDLTHVDLSDEEVIDLVESDFEFAGNLAYIGSNYSPNATIEEIIKRAGMEFDLELGERMDCKSFWKRIRDGGKKVLHGIEKGCRKA